MTSGRPCANSVYRNNRFIGTGGNYAAMSATRLWSIAILDYDGFGGGPWKLFF